jgi:DNA-directed RNA polymerase subunit RPC12/RpoP
VFKEKLTVVAVALGLLFGSIFFPFVRYTAYALLIAVVCGALLLGVVGIVLLVLFNWGVDGPKSLSGTRCQKCGKRRAMEEVSRTFLHGNVKMDFDHYMVLYRCSACDQQEEQEEHVFPNK